MSLSVRTSIANWSGLEALPGIKWAPLPQTSLQNCLPDGGCFARQGVAKFGDHSFTVIASGARTFVTNIYFRSNARAMGETNVLDALKQAGFAPELARCPVKGRSAGRTGIGCRARAPIPAYSPFNPRA